MIAIIEVVLQVTLVLIVFIEEAGPCSRIFSRISSR